MAERKHKFIPKAKFKPPQDDPTERTDGPRAEMGWKKKPEAEKRYSGMK